MIAYTLPDPPLAMHQPVGPGRRHQGRSSFLTVMQSAEDGARPAPAALSPAVVSRPSSRNPFKYLDPEVAHTLESRFHRTVALVQGADRWVGCSLHGKAVRGSESLLS
jgi:hypothetical protein